MLDNVDDIIVFVKWILKKKHLRQLGKSPAPLLVIFRMPPLILKLKGFSIDFSNKLST